MDTIFVACMLLVARESLALILPTPACLPCRLHDSLPAFAFPLRVRHNVESHQDFSWRVLLLSADYIGRFHADDGSALLPVFWDDAEEAAPSDAVGLVPVTVAGAGVAASAAGKSRCSRNRQLAVWWACYRGIELQVDPWCAWRRGRWFCAADSTVLPWRCPEERLWTIVEPPPPRAPICHATAWFGGQLWHVIAWPADTPAPSASSDRLRAKETQQRTPKAPRCGAHTTLPASDAALVYSCRHTDAPAPAGVGLASVLPTAAPVAAAASDGAAEEQPARKPSEVLWPGSWIWSIAAPLADRYVHAIPHRLRMRQAPPPAHARRLVAANSSVAAAAASAAAACGCSRCRCRGSCAGALVGETGEGRCECDSGYSGANCSESRLVVAHARLQPSASCPNGCSAHGVCRNLRCACAQGWTGVDCSTECAGGAENPCSGRGECLFNGTCACHADYGGKDCSKRLVQE